MFNNRANIPARPAPLSPPKHPDAASGSTSPWPLALDYGDASADSPTLPRRKRFTQPGPSADSSPGGLARRDEGAPVSDLTRRRARTISMPSASATPSLRAVQPHTPTEPSLLAMLADAALQGGADHPRHPRGDSGGMDVDAPATRTPATHHSDPKMPTRRATSSPPYSPQLQDVSSPEVTPDRETDASPRVIYKEPEPETGRGNMDVDSPITANPTTVSRSSTSPLTPLTDSGPTHPPGGPADPLVREDERAVSPAHISSEDIPFVAASAARLSTPPNPRPSWATEAPRSASVPAPGGSGWWAVKSTSGATSRGTSRNPSSGPSSEASQGVVNDEEPMDARPGTGVESAPTPVLEPQPEADELEASPVPAAPKRKRGRPRKNLTVFVPPAQQEMQAEQSRDVQPTPVSALPAYFHSMVAARTPRTAQFEHEHEPEPEKPKPRRARLPKTAVPKSAVPKSAVPKSAVPKSAVPKTAVPKGKGKGKEAEPGVMARRGALQPQADVERMEDGQVAEAHDEAHGRPTERAPRTPPPRTPPPHLQPQQSMWSPRELKQMERQAAALAAKMPLIGADDTARSPTRASRMREDVEMDVELPAEFGDAPEGRDASEQRLPPIVAEGSDAREPPSPTPIPAKDCSRAGPRPSASASASRPASATLPLFQFQHYVPTHQPGQHRVDEPHGSPRGHDSRAQDEHRGQHAQHRPQPHDGRQYRVSNEQLERMLAPRPASAHQPNFSIGPTSVAPDARLTTRRVLSGASAAPLADLPPNLSLDEEYTVGDFIVITSDDVLFRLDGPDLAHASRELYAARSHTPAGERFLVLGRPHENAAMFRAFLALLLHTDLPLEGDEYAAATTIRDLFHFLTEWRCANKVKTARMVLRQKFGGMSLRSALAVGGAAEDDMIIELALRRWARVTPVTATPGEGVVKGGSPAHASVMDPRFWDYRRYEAMPRVYVYALGCAWAATTAGRVPAHEMEDMLVRHYRAALADARQVEGEGRRRKAEDERVGGEKRTKG